MSIIIGKTQYTVNDETFEVESFETTSKFHTEKGDYKEPDDVIETVTFKANTEHGEITGQATARRSGYSPIFEIEDVEIKIDNNKIDDLELPECSIEEDED